MSWTLNPNAASAVPYPNRLKPIIGLEAHRDAYAEISSWPGYQPTPMRAAPILASELGLESVWVKDESVASGSGASRRWAGRTGCGR